MNLLVAGVSHKTAPVEIREALAVSREHFGAVLDELAGLPGVREVALLSTCNRVEVYAAVDQAIPADALLAPLRGERAWRLPAGSIERHTFFHEGAEAARHLFRVASGLDSLIVGECQILGQVKEAYEAAKEAGRTGTLLNILFQKALHAAKAVHAETGVSQGKSSVASVALDFMGKVFATLDRKTVLLVGAGQTAELALARLRRYEGVRVMVANRCLEKARKLAAQVGGEAFPLRDLPEVLHQADIAIFATASERPLVGLLDVVDALHRRSGAPLCLLDLSVPRNVDPLVANLPNAYLFDLDDLQEVVAAAQVARKGEAEAGRRCLDEEFAGAWPDLADRLERGGRATPRVVGGRVAAGARVAVAAG
ncbi:MAG: glutamyl-tRNA reductase [Planctomycetes bacterium]|nr:glutamyl-tRNA reductase [Planctomycetota bacterium]